MTRASIGERVFRSLHRMALRAYPASFRDDFATDMDETFVDRYCWLEMK